MLQCFRRRGTGRAAAGGCKWQDHLISQFPSVTRSISIGAGGGAALRPSFPLLKAAPKRGKEKERASDDRGMLRDQSIETDLFEPNDDALFVHHQRDLNVSGEVARESAYSFSDSPIALHRSPPHNGSTLEFVIEAKDSVFQAYVAVDPRLRCEQDIKDLIETLKESEPRLAIEATHPFMYGGLLIGPPSTKDAATPHRAVASSAVSPSSNVRYVHDDDGEKGAGNAMMSVIRTKYESALAANHVGCCVIISRWFGGTMLGPARFKIIATLTDRVLAAYTQKLPSGRGGLRRGT